MTGSELRIVRLLYSNNRFSPYTGMDVDGIITQLELQAEKFNMRGGETTIKPLAIPTVRRSLKSLKEKNYVGEGIKKETYKKTYFLTEDGIAFIKEVISASNEFKKSQSKEDN